MPRDLHAAGAVHASCGELRRQDADVLHPIVRYYDQTWADYRWLWLDPSNLAIHFGYRDGRFGSHARSLLRTNEVLADLAGVQPGDRVLDAGCGIAGSGIWLAEQRAARVCGITRVSSQVERARAQIHRRGLEGRVEVTQGDYTETGFADASFDVVWALESVCHARSKSAFYREAARVLRPGGRLVMAEYLRTGRGLPGAGERLLAEWLGGWMIPDIDTREEHLEHAAKAGFARIEVRDVTRHMRRSLRRLYALSLLGLPTGRLLRRLGLRSDVMHGNVVGAHRQWQALRKGCWFYALLGATKPGSPGAVAAP